jgi:hypothetical protein
MKPFRENNFLLFISSIGLFILSILMSVLTWWPFISIGLILVFALGFLTTTGAIILFSLFCLIFLIVFFVQLFLS